MAANHFDGGRMAAEYLLSLGHRRIAIIAGPRTAAPAKARLDGFMAVMRPIYEQRGLDANDHVVFGPFNLNTGRVGLQHFMSMPAREHPTAIFASADLKAIGALRAAADLGLNVPLDLSIMGYDGIPMGDMVHPRLTTIVQLVSRIAETAIAAVLSPPENRENQALLLNCELLLRDSTAPCGRQHVLLDHRRKPPRSDTTPGRQSRKHAEVSRSRRNAWGPVRP